jgi:alkane 1-monooxygenase
MLAAIPYFFPYLIGSLALAGIDNGGLWSFSGFIFIFAIHPLLDFIFQKKFVSPLQPKELWALLPVILSTPFLLICLIFSLFKIPESTWLEFAGITLSIGALGGVLGINMAHELIHRRSMVLRFLGYTNLILVNFAHWGIEHVYGHHKNVATFEDPATSRKNETVYMFWLRNYFAGFKDALEIEKPRGVFKNRVLIFSAVQAAMALILLTVMGQKVFLAWILISLVSWLLLMTVDYIEHYGLGRLKNENGTYERVQPRHSWDSGTAFTNWALINLGHHAHHHYSASVPYEELQLQKEASQLPYGYSTMILIALVPALFFSIMNPRLSQ